MSLFKAFKKNKKNHKTDEHHKKEMKVSKKVKNQNVKTVMKKNTMK